MIRTDQPCFCTNSQRFVASTIATPWVQMTPATLLVCWTLAVNAAARVRAKHGQILQANTYRRVRIVVGGIPRGIPSFFLWRLSYTDVLMKLFNAFVIGVVVAAAALALIYRREVREMVLPIVRNLW